jgi:hypothetical protein
MPTISIFYGIAIRMYLNDHFPPHFHAIYGDSEACVSIETGALLEGRLPKTAERLVREWLSLNRDALTENWRLARQGQLPRPIGGLDVEQGR